MNKKKLVEYKANECKCDVLYLDGLTVQRFGNSAHIILPKDVLRGFKSKAVVGLWRTR